MTQVRQAEHVCAAQLVSEKAHPHHAGGVLEKVLGTVHLTHTVCSNGLTDSSSPSRSDWSQGSRSEALLGSEGPSCLTWVTVNQILFRHGGHPSDSTKKAWDRKTGRQMTVSERPWINPCKLYESNTLFFFSGWFEASACHLIPEMIC